MSWVVLVQFRGLRLSRWVLIRQWEFIPEDAAVRGPFYNMRFKAIRNELVRKYWEDTGDVANLRLSQEPLRDSVGGIETMGLRHDKTKIPVEELQRIMNLAHRQALQDTREWLYTIERRTNLGKYGEYIWPFISATQNTVTVAGKLLYKEPWLAPMVANIWNMPNRLGLEDEEGNIRLPIVLPGVTEFARKHPEIPVLGGLMGPGDQLTLNKNGINMWAPDTGFGLIPRPGPLAIVPASELMKLGLFPIETPQPVKTALGDEAGTEFYESFKAYIFGEKRGASEVTGSWDLLMPALLQRIGESKSELSKEYGYQYALQEARAMQRFHAGEIDELPTADDIHKMTTNMFWLSVLGQLGVPTPITPYPTLTRPDIQTPAETLQKQMRLYQEKDPQNAMLNFSNDFGDWALQSAMTEVSKDIGGAAPTPATVSDIKTLDPLLRRLAPVLQASGGNLDVLGMLVNNRNSLIGDEPNPDQLFEASAFAWLKAKNIPGINEQWREIPGPGLSSLERQRITGWSMHRQFMDIQEARLASRGLTSFNVAAAADLKAANDRFIANMKANPEMAGWVLDYEDRDTTRITSAVTTMQAAVNDPTFTEFMIKNGKEQTLACMIDYLKYRGAIMELARRSGSGLTAKSNARLAQTWDTIQFKLKQRDVRWADIANRFFANDNNPQAAINVQNVAGL
jgi:hypothetical protein